MRVEFSGLMPSRWKRHRRGLDVAAITRVALFVYCLILPIHLGAQSAANSGQILGHVLDPSGAAVAGAEVRIWNEATNHARVVITDEEGRYVAPLVPLGRHAVTVTATGFAPSSRDALVTLGSSITAHFTLTLEGVSENVQVSATPHAAASTDASVGAILTELQIRDRPSNGRQIEGLLVQTPGAQIEPLCKGYSISGQKGLYANVNVDGGDYNSTFGCGLRGRSESAPTFSMEALAEFQIVRDMFSPEFGRSTGGLVNMSTKSGTNVLHGSAFYLGRSRSLSARDALGQEALSQIHQLGGSLGGPVVRDRTFFFLAPEIQQAAKPVQVLYSALDHQRLRATPAAEALLAAAPEEEITAVSNSRSWISRIDHRLTEDHSVFGRFDFTESRAHNNPGSNYLSSGPSIESVTNRARSGQAILQTRNFTGMAQLTSFLSPSHINELRFQFARELRPRSTVGTGPEVTIWNAGELVGYYGPQASGLGFGNLGFASSDDRMQLVDNFSIFRGAHAVKAGFDYSRIKGNIVFNPGSNALYLFSSLDDFVNRKPTQYQQFIGTGEVDLTVNLFAAYLQDEWRPLRGLTLTPGIRYEAQFNPDYPAPGAPDERAPTATSIPDDTKMIAPRLGVAWDMDADGKTVLRAGGGLFHASTHLGLLAQSILFNGGNPDLASRIIVTNAADLAAAFSSIGIDLGSAGWHALPVFTAEQIRYFFGALREANLSLRAPT